MRFDLLKSHSHSLKTRGIYPMCDLWCLIRLELRLKPCHNSANMGLLISVCPLVSDDMGPFTESSPTVYENMELLPFVHPLVCDETWLVEASPKLFGNIGLLSGVWWDLKSNWSLAHTTCRYMVFIMLKNVSSVPILRAFVKLTSETESS